MGNRGLADVEDYPMSNNASRCLRHKAWATLVSATNPQKPVPTKVLAFVVWTLRPWFEMYRLGKPWQRKGLKATAQSKATAGETYPRTQIEPSNSSARRP